MYDERAPKKVRVQLDYDGGKLTFVNLDTRKVLKTIRVTFAEQVFPFLDLYLPL